MDSNHSNGNTDKVWSGFSGLEARQQRFLELSVPNPITLDVLKEVMVEFSHNFPEFSFDPECESDIQRMKSAVNSMRDIQRRKEAKHNRARYLASLKREQRLAIARK